MSVATDEGRAGRQLVVEIDDFVNGAECEFVLNELDFVHWRHSHLIGQSPEGEELAFTSPRRVSETANQEWFTDELNGFVGELEQRLARIFPLDPSRLEFWQATRYPLQGELDHHLDAGYWGNHYAGERERTFLIYLTTPVQGGATYFRALDREVRPVAGKLVSWENLFEDGRPNHRAIHCGSTLKAGRKITLITWLRQRRFRVE